ncbi:MAG TPA: SAM-dependent chlorinase/fluorinase [Gaiellaceae bacterium]|nr:SAM-dependent chlorinase/fluorinase [Gaiellaceae bacterium]
MPAPLVITFLTDFGVADDLVGTCHGVMKRITPDAEIIDITHGIDAQRVLQGALVLRNTMPYMPEGVHLAVVDPGVGTDRRALALRTGSGRLYVGPDNGLLVPAAEATGGVEDAWELTEPAYRLEPVSHTFHGRDLFAPAAAYLAGGLEPRKLGPALDPSTLVRLDVPVPQVSGSQLVAHVLIVDRFGNVQLNLTAGDLEQVGILPGTRIELEIGLERYYAVAARTFADVARGDIVLYEDSYRNVSIAINAGDAASVISARAGDRVRIRSRG